MPLPPQKLNNKHRLIAYMKLGGATREEIAFQLGYEPTYVSAITESPLFKALMSELQNEMKHQTIGTVVDRIVAEGPKSLQVLVELRDHAESEQIRMTSARDLLDRNPETAKVSREDRRTETRIIVDSRALHRIAGVLQEDNEGVIDLDAVQALSAPTPPPGIVPLAEAVAALQATEGA